MTDTLFDHAFRRDIARLADAMEGLLAYLVGATPTLAAKPPADFDGAQYAFDAMMGNPLAALGNLSPFAELTRNEPIGIALNDAQVGEELRVKLTFRAPAAAPVKPAKRRWTHWSKLDPRSRELAKLATAAGKRMKAAKTPETREAARVEKAGYLNESKARQKRLRGWLDAGKGIIDGDALYYFDADGTKVKFVPSPTTNFFLPY
jgi:hypothetical protein